MSRYIAIAFLVAAFLAAHDTAEAQLIFLDDFESASICQWSNADQTDNDGDTYKICAFDCDDGDQSINPGATDSCGDGIDNDCTGFADEACCHPLLQNCPGGTDACYYALETHTFLCAAPFGNPPGQQEDPCSYQNACDKGFGCTVCIPPGCAEEDLLCAAFCDPDINDCASGETCLYYDEFWGNVAPAPDDFGMCVPNEALP